MELLCNLLNTLKKAYLLKQGLVYFCYYKSIFILKFLRLLVTEGYVLGFNKNTCYVRIKLKFNLKGLPSLKLLKNFTQPTKPKHISANFLQTQGFGLILSTKFGLLTAERALFKYAVKNGGRLLCQCY
jgi:ribosomal protein S8